MERITELFPENDADELFNALDSKEYWLLLMMDVVPIGAIISELSKKMKKPPKTFSVKGLPPVIALPKADFDAEALARIMTLAAPGIPLPPDLLRKALWGRDLIMCAEPQSMELGLEAMERFIRRHREWKVERFGVQLFTVTHRLYQDDYKEAIDFLIWMLAGIVTQTGTKRDRTDIEVVTAIGETIYETTVGGKERAQKTMDSLQKSQRFLEPAMKILDAVIKDKNNRDRARSMLRMWLNKRDIDPNDCAMWVASNIGLYMTHYDCGEAMLYTVTEQLLLRIRDNFGIESLTSKRK